MSRLVFISCVIVGMVVMFGSQTYLISVLDEAVIERAPLQPAFSLNDAALAMLPFIQCLLFLLLFGVMHFLEKWAIAEISPVAVALLVCGILQNGADVAASVSAYKSVMSILLAWVPPFIFADVLLIGMKGYKIWNSANPDTAGIYSPLTQRGGTKDAIRISK